MKRTDARKPESGHAPRSNQPFFDAKAATAFFASGQSVQRDPFFQRPASASIPIQAKLTVGAVGDKYEQEADRVASSVVDQINRPAGPQGGDRSSVQRLGGEEEVQMRRSPDALQRVEQEEELQMKPIADTIQRMGPAEEEELQMKPDSLQRETDPEEEDELQMKAIAPQVTAQGGDVSSDLESTIQQVRGGGQAIAENVRVPLEQAFGADFSGVRVHTNAKSDQLNQSIQAKAFTTGQDVFFRQGTYQPGSRVGQELIAHELTHVVQQGGNRPTVQRLGKDGTERRIGRSLDVVKRERVKVENSIHLKPQVIQRMSKEEAAALDSFDYGSVILIDIGTNPHQTVDGNDLWKYIWKSETKGLRNIELHWHGGSIDPTRINIRWEGETGSGVGRQIPDKFMAALKVAAKAKGWV